MLGLGACQPSTEVELPNPVVWGAAPESSRIEYMPRDKNGVALLTRCWPARGAWDCLYVIEIEFRGSSSYTVERMTRPEPQPGSSWLAVSGADAINYQCSFTIDYPGAYRARNLEEMLRRNENTLLSNTRYPGDSRIDSVSWTPEFVNEFVAENGGKAGSAWFDCDYVARLAAQGSIETLTTTALKRGDL